MNHFLHEAAVISFSATTGNESLTAEYVSSHVLDYLSVPTLLLNRSIRKNKIKKLQFSEICCDVTNGWSGGQGWLAWPREERVQKSDFLAWHHLWMRPYSLERMDLFYSISFDKSISGAKGERGELGFGILPGDAGPRGLPGQKGERGFEGP